LPAAILHTKDRLPQTFLSKIKNQPASPTTAMANYQKNIVA